MDNNDNNGENSIEIADIPEKLKSGAKDFRKLISKYITKREIIIVVAVALVIFLVMCDKPYSGDFFSVWRPAFWSVQKISNDDGYKITIPRAGASDSGVELDNVIIKDISSVLSDEIATPKDYILDQINFQVDRADKSHYARGTVVEQFQLFDVGRMNMSGQESYYFVFSPGGEYSGNKLLQVAVKKGDKMILATYRSRWMNFDDNYQKAYNLINSIRIK
jgi:hypothetical protein